MKLNKDIVFYIQDRITNLKKPVLYIKSSLNNVLHKIFEDSTPINSNLLYSQFINKRYTDLQAALT